MIHPAERRIEALEVIDNGGAGINVERRAVGCGQRVEIDFFTVKETLLV